MVEFTGRTKNRAAALDAAFNQHVVNAQTGTSYTLLLTDRGNLITLSNASAVTLTVPPASAVDYPLWTIIRLLNKGAGIVTVTPGSGVTFTGPTTLAQYASAMLVKTGTNAWLILPRPGFLRSGPNI